MLWSLVYTAIVALFPTPVFSASARRAWLGLNKTMVSLVRDNAVNISTHRWAEHLFLFFIFLFVLNPRFFTTASGVDIHSWEIGTLAEALTEAEWPWLTPFMPIPVIPPTRLPWWENAHDVLAIAET
jgi:hypothetical protein